MIDIYTSTGRKYAHHANVFRMLRNGFGRPQSLQVSPTNRCNLRCVFCSVDNRSLKLEWDFDELKSAIKSFMQLGVGTVEFSGGGDPTLYPRIQELAEYCRGYGLRIGMITNGIKLHEFPTDFLRLFSWIRVSMVTLDYHESLHLPEFPSGTVLGMSYVVGQINYTGGKTPYLDDEYRKLVEVRRYAIKHDATYVRVVPECFTDEESMVKLHGDWADLVADIGPPLFFQAKFQRQAHHCWMDAVKPWLHTDGYVYPCNSVSLNTSANRDFDPSWRLCHWTEVENYYNTRSNASLPTSHCDRCTFTKNNDIVEGLITPMQHEEFV